jgi:CRISPR-associated protein Cst2
MAFVAGMMLIDAPASALNNAGAEEGARTDNTIAVKRIRGRAGGDYPYVSAQAVRYWLRTYLERSVPEWQTAPVLRETKIAYTDANPLRWWDDDLFGYMRAPSKRAGAREGAPEENQTPLTGEITRISPLRMGTLVAIAPVKIVDDFGTMSRHEGNPVPHEHQFCRATLQGLFSLDLSTAGTFFNGGRVGYRNLDEVRVKLAKEQELNQLTVHGQPAFRLPPSERARRVAALVRAIGELEGGAKLTLHYTDVTPGLVVCAVVKSGNNPFARIVRPNSQSEPEIVADALKEVLRVYKDQIYSSVFVGWARGYLDEQRSKVEALSVDDLSGVSLSWGHPREVMAQLAGELSKETNHPWYN